MAPEGNKLTPVYKARPVRLSSFTTFQWEEYSVMNVPFLSRLKIRTKGREGEISGPCDLEASYMLQASSLGTGFFHFRQLAALSLALAWTWQLATGPLMVVGEPSLHQ